MKILTWNHEKYHHNAKNVKNWANIENKKIQIQVEEGRLGKPQTRNLISPNRLQTPCNGGSERLLMLLGRSIFYFASILFDKGDVCPVGKTKLWIFRLRIFRQIENFSIEKTKLRIFRLLMLLASNKCTKYSFLHTFSFFADICFDQAGWISRYGCGVVSIDVKLP